MELSNPKSKSTGSDEAGFGLGWSRINLDGDVLLEFTFTSGWEEEFLETSPLDRLLGTGSFLEAGCSIS
jgi:hypothetical protein